MYREHYYSCFSRSYWSLSSPADENNVNKLLFWTNLFPEHAVNKTIGSHMKTQGHAKNTFF